MRSLFLVLLAVALVPVNVSAAPSTAEKSTAKRISSHIQQSGQLRNYRIGVTYQNGVALLNGTVTTEQQKQAAIQLAKEVKGVKQVVCKLECTQEEDAQLTASNEQSSEEKTGETLESEFAEPADNANALRASFQGQKSGVVQAYADPDRGLVPPMPQPPMQRQPMMARNNAPMPRQRMMPRNNMPLGAPRPMDRAVRQASVPCEGGYAGMGGGGAMGMGPGMGPMPAGVVPTSYGRGPSYENAQMPGYAWPSYASYPNYAALSYPQQYSPTAWPYIGPFYPYPQVPLAWRKVSLEWDDGWWFLDFSAHNSSH